jgi:predicted amidophosphoribosyltransferase
MTMHFDQSNNRGGATVGSISDLDAIAAASVIYLRMWCDGPENQHNVQCDFASTLGADRGQRALESFTELCSLCARHGRRPMMRHAVSCKCLGADEACFANFIAIAADGERDDAMLIATLLVRPDVAPVIAALAMDFGLALKQMNLAAPRDVRSKTSIQTTLH